jgi:hypothetical protein
MRLQGGCCCGQVRYEVVGEPFNCTNCHCSICRRTSAAPFVGWFTVARKDLHWLRGKPGSFQSTAKGTRSFCRDCGTPLTFVHEDFAGEIDVTTCSLDAPAELAPLDHVWTSSQLPWIRLADGLPAYRESRNKP